MPPPRRKNTQESTNRGIPSSYEKGVGGGGLYTDKDQVVLPSLMLPVIDNPGVGRVLPAAGRAN